MELQNRILIDWITFSCPDCDFKQLLYCFGLTLDWKTGLKSRLMYTERWEFGGISVHFTHYGADTKYNSGVCFELSGQGCRMFEEVSFLSLSELLQICLWSGFKISRLDIAYDDFTGLIPLDVMARQAMRFEYTSRLHAVKVIHDCPDQCPDHVGLSVCHGSRSSRTFFRCYDKRVERGRFDLEHWVRFEIQFRDECAMGFAENQSPIGEKFAGVLVHYLEYLNPSSDLNKSRWLPVQWWSDFVQDAQAISVYHVADLEYNKSRLDRHIYRQNAGTIKTEILCDGVRGFLDRVFSDTRDLNPKYQRIIQGQKNSQAILDTLDELSNSEENYTDWSKFL